MLDVKKEQSVIRMYGVIGEYEDEISAIGFMQALDQFDGEDITIQLKSPGGEIDDGLSIYNQIEKYPGKVTVEIDSQAASIATVFPMAADEIVMRRRSEMFIHDPWTMAMGNSREFRATASYLDALAMEIAGVYADRTGMDPEYWFNVMAETKRYSAQEAVEAGLADRVIGPQGMPKKPSDRIVEPQKVSARLRGFATAKSLDMRMRILNVQ